MTSQHGSGPRQRQGKDNPKYIVLPLGAMVIDYMVGDTFAEIGDRYGVSWATVKDRLYEHGVPRADRRKRGHIPDAAWLAWHPELAGHYGPEVPFAHLAEKDLRRLEDRLSRATFTHFIMTHDGDGYPLGNARPAGLKWVLPFVNAQQTRAAERWRGMHGEEPGNDLPPDWERAASTCLRSTDGGRTWVVFNPPPPTSKALSDPAKRTPPHHWLDEVAVDLRNAGLMPRFRTTRGARAR